MSQENVQALKEGYDAFQRGDMDAAFKTFADDITLRGGSDSIPGGGTYHGIDEVRGRWLQEFGATYEDFRMTTDEILDCGNTLIVLGTARGRLRGSSEELKNPYCHVWRYDGEKIVEVRFFNDSAQTLLAIQQMERATTT